MCDSVPMSADPSPSATPLAPPAVRPDPSPLRFTDSVVLVVGGAHGIGAATAERLAAEGASVVVGDIDVDAATRTRDALPVVGGARHEAVRIDITDVQDVESVIAGVGERYGQLDALIHVAGGDTANPSADDGSEERWLRLVDLNLQGPARTTRAAIPLLRRSPRGAIVAVSSVNGLMAIGGEPYSASKAGLGSLVQNLAVRLGPEGVRVNAVAPGTIRTRVWDGQGDPEGRLHWYPLGRIGESADVAAAIAFLASRDAAWITGQVLAVDGGLVLRGPGPEAG